MGRGSGDIHSKIYFDNECLLLLLKGGGSNQRFWVCWLGVDLERKMLICNCFISNIVCCHMMLLLLLSVMFADEPVVIKP